MTPTPYTAEPFVPHTSSLNVLRKASKTCRGCPLYLPATQTVFGEGLTKARAVLVGEQPGDQEDKQGHPFVGPSGKMLDRALEDAGIDRTLCYVTNAVKHFKFEPRGKRRIHVKPGAREIEACKPWLRAELEILKPAVLIVLGATAAQSLLGRAFRITQSRGQVIDDTEWATRIVATVHPSALLRIPDSKGRQDAYAHFVADLKVAAKYIKKG